MPLAILDPLVTVLVAVASSALINKYSNIMGFYLTATAFGVVAIGLVWRIARNKALLDYLGPYARRRKRVFLIVCGTVGFVAFLVGGLLFQKHYEELEQQLHPAPLAKATPLSRPRWVTAHVPTASGIVLIADLSAQENVASINVRVLVTAPDGRAYWGARLEARNVTSVQLHQTYPKDFVGAPPLGPGTYQVEWLGESDRKNVIARDSFNP